jgi:hypothetical protein
MARIRSIKHGFFTNEELADCSRDARLLFIGLWVIADREGRLKDRPRKIKVEVFPYDDVEVSPLLDELQQAKFLIRYQVNGEPYIQILNFTKHQRPHPNEPASEIPPPQQFTTNPEQLTTSNEHFTASNEESRQGTPEEVASENQIIATRENKLQVVKNNEQSFFSNDKTFLNTDNSVRSGDGNGDGEGEGGVGGVARKARSPNERRPTLCDDDFLDSLQAKEVYSQLNVRKVYGKMCTWCELKGKVPTRARLVSWLNREEVPMQSKPNGATSLSGIESTHPKQQAPASTLSDEERELARQRRLQRDAKLLQQGVSQ